MRSLSGLSLSPEGLAFNPATGDTFMVNESGAAILKAIQGGAGLGDVVRLLTDSFSAPRDVAERDILDFQDRLRSFGLL
jgi:coenzyme PQQ synthesis protein D (PqqD)